jgi:hypothetical protein
MPPENCFTGFFPVSASANWSSSSLARVRGARGREVVEPTEQLQVLPSGQGLVDGRVLADEPDVRPHPAGFPRDVEPGDHGPARVRFQQCGEDADGGGLPGAVGPEDPVHGALADRQVDPVQRGLLAEPLPQPLSDDQLSASPLSYFVRSSTLPYIVRRN